MVSKKKPSLRLALKVAAASLIGLILPSGCTTPPVTCYVPSAPTDTPTPFVTCYTALPPETPPASPLSPLSPLPTPTPSEDARGTLREKLLAGNRFPEAVARRLHE